ncbi:type 2 periplasmic-binding domain-containing protein [Entomobacter blattae]|uniref:ABC-type glycine betaine transport system substrate-binding domain-containing protein n=1 Tax=Entomobacter blattae TaxID=2762277 RepID=A0A7H1NPC1_9PROT|nr:hypothetical protein [Entomobacter blattae]QNT77631.1 hypothetical protein JGUZn3_03800 [Entomobacter blattae]
MNFRLGYINTLRHELNAAVILRVLDAYGIDTDLTTGEGRELASMFAKGELDMVVSLWLPDYDAALFPIADSELIGDLYTSSLCIAGPNTGGVENCKALMGLQNAKLYVADGYRQWVGHFLDRYELLPSQIELLSLPEQDEQFSTRIGKEAHSYYCWPEGSFLASLAGKALADPLRVLPVSQKAQLLIHRSSRKNFDSDLFDELEGLLLGQKVLFALEEAVIQKGMTPAEAAEAWQRGRLIGR